MISNTLILLSSIALSAIISVLITSIGIIWYITKINEIYYEFMDEYAESIKVAVMEVLREKINKKGKAN